MVKFVKNKTMAYLINEDSSNENLKLLLSLAQKLKISISEISSEEQEDFLLGELMLKEESEEYVSREELFQELKKK